MDDIHQEAMEQFKESQEESDFNRTDYEEDVTFSRLADQWPREIRDQRRDEGRPCLTVNKLPAFIRQVVNDARQHKPGIKVSPVDNGADEDTAEVIGGLVRAIERMSNADVAYDTAIDHAVTGGFGFFRIGIDYAHEDSFELEAYIDRVPNPLMVHWDVNSSRFDASDWDYAFLSDFYNEDEFERAFPKADKVSFQADRRDDVSYWLQDDRIRVSEYWRREKRSRVLVQFRRPDGGLIALREDQLPRLGRTVAERGGLDLSGFEDEDVAREYVNIMGLEEVRRRDADYHEVKRYLLNGQEVLEEDPWPGSMIPICPVWGDEVIIEGRRHFRSMIRDAKDPQTMFNFWRSASTELVALAPRAPWVGPKGFVPEGDEQKWETANTRSHAYLEFEPGQHGQVPQRQAFAGVPGGALQESLNANDDMKSVMSIYDPSLGAESNEKSGRAILARQRESDTSNFHFIDNLSRAIRYAGQVLVEIIPAVYSDREAIRILGDDQAEKVVNLTTEDGGGLVNEEGERQLYNIAVGKYDVTVDSGPSYATQREETREFLLELMRQVPGAAEFLGDIALDHMDFPGADEAAERLRKAMQARGILPPEGGGAAQMPMGGPQQGQPEAPAQGPVPSAGGRQFP